MFRYAALWNLVFKLKDLHWFFSVSKHFWQWFDYLFIAECDGEKREGGEGIFIWQRMKVSSSIHVSGCSECRVKWRRKEKSSTDLIWRNFTTTARASLTPLPLWRHCDVTGLFVDVHLLPGQIPHDCVVAPNIAVAVVNGIGYVF